MTQDTEKLISFNHIVLAFGHFAGKSLRVLDVGSVLTIDQVEIIEEALTDIGLALINKDFDNCPDANKLGNQILDALARS